MSTRNTVDVMAAWRMASDSAYIPAILRSGEHLYQQARALQAEVDRLKAALAHKTDCKCA